MTSPLAAGPFAPHRALALLATLLLLAASTVFAAPAGAATTAVSGWVLASEGTVVTFGGATHHGDTSRNATAVSLVPTAAGDGYWVLWDDGVVTAHGAATHHGDIGDLDLQLARPAVSLSVLPGEDGYIVLGEDGGVFTFGAARFHGSVPGVSLAAAQQTTAVAIQLSAAGYRIVHDDGGVFAFGDSTFGGSVPGVLNGRTLDQPIADALAGANGSYAMVARDGGVFAFGLQFSGSLGGTGRTDVVGAAADDLGGYALVTTSGTVYWFGSGQRVSVTTSLPSSAADVAIADVVIGDPPVNDDPPVVVDPGIGAVIWSNHDQAPASNEYYDPPWVDQGNWRSPDLIIGEARLELEVLSKPTSHPVEIQVCAWRFLNGVNWSGGFQETCSPQYPFTDEMGPTTVDLGSPLDWWVLNGQPFPWDIGPDVLRIMIKDSATQTLMMTDFCGGACWGGSGSVEVHLPIRMRTTLTFGN